MIDTFWYSDGATLGLANHTQVSSLNMLHGFGLIKLQAEIRYVRLSPKQISCPISRSWVSQHLINRRLILRGYQTATYAIYATIIKSY
jgi:hypothetical protein